MEQEERDDQPLQQDFMIAVQSPVQKMLPNFGPKVVCVASTHETTG